jgi:hypothetical protein
MTSLNISLPDPLKAYVEGRVASGDYGTLDALQSKEFVITPEELSGHSLVAVLREKLARP